MTRSSRPLAAARRSVLLASAVGGLMLAGVPMASAAAQPAPALSVASPGSGIPVLGGLIDSVVGIITGTVFGVAGAAGAAGAVVCSVAPACVPVTVTS